MYYKQVSQVTNRLSHNFFSHHICRGHQESGLLPSFETRQSTVTLKAKKRLINCDVLSGRSIQTSVSVGVSFVPQDLLVMGFCSRFMLFVCLNIYIPFLTTMPFFFLWGQELQNIKLLRDFFMVGQIQISPPSLRATDAYM